jgi:hypothetical protein
VQTTAIDQTAGIIKASAWLGGMDRVGLAGLRHQRDGDAAPDASSTDLCPPLIAGEDDIDAPDSRRTSQSRQDNASGRGIDCIFAGSLD